MGMGFFINCTWKWDTNPPTPPPFSRTLLLLLFKSLRLTFLSMTEIGKIYFLIAMTHKEKPNLELHNSTKFNLKVRIFQAVFGGFADVDSHWLESKSSEDLEQI